MSKPEELLGNLEQRWARMKLDRRHIDCPICAEKRRSTHLAMRKQLQAMRKK